MKNGQRDRKITLEESVKAMMEAYKEGVKDAGLTVESELARLRKIEAAAREYVEQISVAEINGGMNWRAANATEALRAALEAKPC